MLIPNLIWDIVQQTRFYRIFDDCRGDSCGRPNKEGDHKSRPTIHIINSFHNMNDKPKKTQPPQKPINKKLQEALRKNLSRRKQTDNSKKPLA